LCDASFGVPSLQGYDVNVFVSVSGRCVRTWPPEACLVALISGYFDDSQSTGDVWVVAGYVGYANQWEHLGRMWDEALRAHDVPYFHKREMADPAGAFAKWLPPEDHQEEVVAFFKDLVGAIRRCGVHIITSAVWVKDLERFNSEKGLILEPYPLAAYSCMSQIALKHGDVPVTAVFDRVEKVDDKLRKARLYADTDRHAYPGLCNLVTSIPLEAGLTSRTVPALQAADLIAWEVRKALFKMKPWQLQTARSRLVKNNGSTIWSGRESPRDKIHSLGNPWTR
jgi:hypothetical protein